MLAARKLHAKRCGDRYNQGKVRDYIQFYCTIDLTPQAK